MSLAAPLPRTLEPEVMDTANEADDYDAMDHAAVNGAFCDDLLRLRPHPRRVLDLGTGTARIPILLCERAPGVTVEATDLADHMLRIAAKNVARAGFGARITLRKDDAKRLSSGQDEPNDAFDVVASNSVLHHIPRPEVALAAWWARVPPGALFFVRDLLRPESSAEVESLVARHAGRPPVDATVAQRASFERQVELFRASLHAALRLDELRAIGGAIGIPDSAVTQTSDRHFTLGCEKPR